MANFLCVLNEQSRKETLFPKAQRAAWGETSNPKEPGHTAPAEGERIRGNPTYFPLVKLQQHTLHTGQRLAQLFPLATPFLLSLCIKVYKTYKPNI